MEIKSSSEGTCITLSLIGKLDTNTAPELSEYLKTVLTPELESMILDLQEISYVSSAGLRVILTLQKHFPDNGAFKLRNVNDEVMDVLEMTGFADIVTIE